MKSLSYLLIAAVGMAFAPGGVRSDDEKRLRPTSCRKRQGFGQEAVRQYGKSPKRRAKRKKTRPSTK